MSRKAQNFRLQRVPITLAGGVQAVYAPMPCQNCTVMNPTGSAASLKVCTTDDGVTDNEYVAIAAGFERALPGLTGGAYYNTRGTPAFWLATDADLTVILLWN